CARGNYYGSSRYAMDYW
nr:immunoglobulin heavy chain junction region [Mus musculus]